MNARSPKWLGVGEWLLNRRWWWISLASLSVFFFEFMEYEPFQKGVVVSFLFEILFYGVVLPVSTGLALSWLATSRSELAWSIYSQNLKHNLDLQLHNSHTHAKLAEVIMQFTRVVIPVAGVAIYKYDRGLKSYQNILNWFPGKNPESLPSISNCTLTDCPCRKIQPDDDVMALHLCRDPHNLPQLIDEIPYCIPFTYSAAPVASARLYLPSKSAPSLEQIRILKEVAPEIASAFHRVQLERLMQQQDDKINTEQRRIARDVHDTLGHSLAYLRLRLDQISMEFNPGDMNGLQQEVKTLRDVAKEAYEQMRDMLITLSPTTDLSMNDTLEKYATRISKRANFELKIVQTGKPRMLSPLTHRNIINIFREVLTNIENHAHARQVELGFAWKKKYFEINIKDNGVGFDPSLPVQYGHFGLNNIQERAVESNIQLSISSRPGHGTQVVLRIPYEEVR